MPKPQPARPAIHSITTAKELRRWYWLKSELTAEAKRLGVKTSGAKFTVLERLCHFHKTGSTLWPGDQAKKPASKFDWHASPLTPQTLITDSYKNTQNVRRFFQQHASPSFKFNIALMEWMKANTGKTLADAVDFWLHQKANPQKTKIKPHNQFNQYVRDFMEDNPKLGLKDARAAWAKKKRLPSNTGRHRYHRSDLKL